MKEVRTVCARDCYDACGLIVGVDETGRVVSVKGDPDHPHTRGLTCPRAAKDPERLYKDRVKRPSLKRGDTFQEISWEEGLSLLSERLSGVLAKYGPEAVLYLDYAGNTGLLTQIFPRRLWRALGATRTDLALCSKSGHAALAMHYGAGYGVTPPELLSMALIVFWGFNAAVSAPHLWALARKTRNARGTRIVVIDPVRTRTAGEADLWIQPRPGSDVALAYGIIRHLIEREHLDRDFIAEWTVGFDALRKEAGQWTPERAEGITGVSPKQLEALGEAYGEVNPSATLIGIGLQKCDRGADQVRAASFIPALLGRHRGFFYSNGDASFLRISPLSGEDRAKRPGRVVSQVAIPEYVREGAFKLIYVSGMNPALTLPNQNAFREGLSRRDVFVAVHETHWTQTARMADLVLPAPGFLEKEDLVIPWSHDLVRLSPRAVSPVTDSRSEIRVMQELAKRLGLKEEWLYQEPWEAVGVALEGALGDGDFESVRAGRGVRLRAKPKERYSTPSGKVEFWSSRAEEMGLDPLPKQVPLAGEGEAFGIITSATPEYTHTQFQEVYGPIPAKVLMNPEDAKRLRIEDGDRVALSNDLGRVTMGTEISDRVPVGVLWSPRQSEGLAGGALNSLMSSKPQEIGQGPRFNSTRVRVSKDSE
jgi:anaerobic selenocysteine-containing dehydrogenase